MKLVDTYVIWYNKYIYMRRGTEINNIIRGE